MILAIRTDAPEANLVLLNDDGSVLSDVHWQADRRLAHELLGKLESLLTEHGGTWKDLSGLVVYQGPGSFTGLRIGITVMNTIAYAQTIPIVGTTSDKWISQGIELLANGKGEKIVLPEYGAEAHITKPRK
jgi:tRNA threonylcarbamoyladenosine biosynthesis protein TsaB